MPKQPTIELLSASDGFDGETCWVHARGGAVPGAGLHGNPAVVLTLQKLRLSGSDIFYDLHDLRTDDLGANWVGPTHQPTLTRQPWPAGGPLGEQCPCDFTPKWHAASGKLLGTGHIAHYIDDELVHTLRPRRTCYSTYDPKARSWTAWRTVEMPEEGEGGKFYSSGAGSVQRVDLPGGDLLIPIYFTRDAARKVLASTVMKCAFDGETLRYVDHGDELFIDSPRGLYEPSLAHCGEKFYLTMRNDDHGYVSVSLDGQHFSTPQRWTFDDGSDLGNYNTQQHWLTHGGRLWLAYTRRGLDNDHVFRHRAPLVLGEVDLDRLCILRESEQILVPQRGARLGNFGVAEVGANESWVTVTEWMQPVGCEKYGSNNAVWVSKVKWE